MIRRYTRPEMGKIWSEEEKFRAWLKVEILACEAWAEKRKIPKTALREIKEKADFSIERMDELEKKLRHDVVAFTTNLAEHIGPASKYVHMGLTSSDVGDTAQNYLLSRAAKLLIADIKKVINALETQALAYRETMMMGRTHGVHAEPVTLGLKFLLWREEMRRNLARMKAARKAISVGKISGAVGTYAHTGDFLEKYVCKKLGLTPAPISTQVIQRDRHAEFMFAIASTGATIEKIALEVRNLQKSEVREVEEPFSKGQKGSSAMPHKRNPVTCEQLCGLARVLRGNLHVSLENVALWHERDISHSSVERVILPDSTTLLDYMLNKILWVVENMHIYPKRMKENMEITKGLLFSQKVMLALVDKGLTREEAYGIVQRNAMKTWKGTQTFRENLLSDKEFKKTISGQELRSLMDYKGFLKHVDAIYRHCDLKKGK